MNGQWDKWKDKLLRGGKNQWLIFLLAGLILFVISIPAENPIPSEPENTAEYRVRETDKAENLEKKLETVLKKVDGVGEARVLITLKSDGKKLVEKDASITESASSGAASDQMGNTLKDSSRTENTVYERNSSGGESPYVTEKIEPEVAGVLVVAEGGDNPVIVSDITAAVQALFGMEAHKIKVMKMDVGGKA